MGTDGNGNGIGDTPYNVSGSSNSKDNFPLMEWPFERITSNPGPFSLSSPDAGTPDDDGQFTLDWTLSSGSDNYTLYRGNSWFSTYNGSQTILVNEQNIFSFSENLSINGTYYYRVLAKNATGSTYSDAQCIWIDVGIPPLPPPGPFSLSSPDAGIPDDDGQFTLDWTLSSGTDNYTLYMSLNVPFNTFDGSQTILVNEENVNTFLVSLTQNGTYYFRVCARNSAGEEYSDLGSIAIIVQIEPEPINGDGGIDPGIPGYNIFLLIGIIFLGITFFKNRIQHCIT